MNCDILFEMPYYCDDCETWHQNFIWAYEDGTYSICDTDGNHDPLEQEDVPSQEEYDQAWRDYAQWVVDTGKDPLGNYPVQQVRKVKERWEFKAWRTLVGPRLSAARRGKRMYQPQELPEHVRTYLQLSKDNRLGDFKTWEELVEAVPEVKPYQWFVAHLEQDQPRKDTVIARELRKAARKALTNQ